MLDDRPFQPTEQRREQARHDGHVPRGTDLTAASVLLVAALSALLGGGWFIGELAGEFQHQLSAAAIVRAEELASNHSPWKFARYLISVTAVPVILFWTVAVVTQWGQVGGNWLPHRIAPDFQRLGPSNRLRRLVSTTSLVDVGLIAIRMTVGISVASMMIWASRERLWASGTSNVASLTAAGQQVATIVVCLAAAFCVVAIFEFGWQWWKHEGELMMTAEQAREDARQQQGDLRIRALQRGAHQRLTSNERPARQEPLP